MNKELEEKFNKGIETLYNTMMEKPMRVLSIFNDFYGEDKVDMQGYPTLEEFNTYIRRIDIAFFIPNSSILNLPNMSPKDWDSIKKSKIEELDSNNVIESIINALSNPEVVKYISSVVDPFILVHFPHVRVKNENGRYIDINHLFAKIRISVEGTMIGKFALNRSEYTMIQFNSNYMHSHIRTIPKSNFTEFQIPCTGSGPINSTITTLNSEYDEDIWNLFCLELSKFVSVESLEGGPYHYLERLGYSRDNTPVGLGFLAHVYGRLIDGPINRESIIEFIKYFINCKKLRFNYINGEYSIGMSPLEYITLISNKFIEWYNAEYNKGNVTASFRELKNSRVLRDCIRNNNTLYYFDNPAEDTSCSEYIGEKVCNFKGKEITLNITDIKDINKENKSVILNVNFALYILTIILKVINYRYGREHRESNETGTEIWYL